MLALSLSNTPPTNESKRNTSQQPASQQSAQVIACQANVRSDIAYMTHIFKLLTGWSATRSEPHRKASGGASDKAVPGDDPHKVEQYYKAGYVFTCCSSHIIPKTLGFFMVQPQRRIKCSAPSSSLFHFSSTRICDIHSMHARTIRMLNHAKAWCRNVQTHANVRECIGCGVAQRVAKVCR